LSGGILELFERDQALGLVTKIDDDIFAGNAEDSALENFIGRWWGKMAVILEEILVVFYLPIVLVYGHYASASH
jgi:hypothetical protein